RPGGDEYHSRYQFDSPVVALVCLRILLIWIGSECDLRPRTNNWSRSVTPPAYPAARLAAARINSRLERHHSILLPQLRRAAAVVPDMVAIEAIIEAAFWASLLR